MNSPKHFISELIGQTNDDKDADGEIYKGTHTHTQRERERQTCRQRARLIPMTVM